MIPMKAHSNPCHKIDTAAPYRSVDIILWRSHEDAYHWNFLDWFNKMYLEMKGHILYVLAWFIFVEFIWYSLGYFSSTTKKECKLKFEFLYISSDEIRESKNAIKKKMKFGFIIIDTFHSTKKFVSKRRRKVSEGNVLQVSKFSSQFLVAVLI